MPLEEIVISHYADADFGALQLIEIRTVASRDGGLWSSLICREWAGRLENIDATISISNSKDPPRVADEIRMAFRSVVSDVEGFRRRIARDELELAKRWLAETGVDPLPDEDAFCKLLKIMAFRMDEGRVTVWLRETANIFRGHQLEVRINLEYASRQMRSQRFVLQGDVRGRVTCVRIP